MPKLRAGPPRSGGASEEKEDLEEHSEEKEPGGDKTWSWGLHRVFFGDAPGGESHGAGLGVLIDPVGCNRDDQGRDGDRARYLNTDPHEGHTSSHGDTGALLPTVPTQAWTYVTRASSFSGDERNLNVLMIHPDKC